MSRPRVEAGQIEGAPEIDETDLTAEENLLLHDALYDVAIASLEASRAAMKRGDEPTADAAQRRAGALRRLILKLYPPQHGEPN